MKIVDTEIRVGTKKPFSILHVSDTHLTRADDRDDERKIRLSEDRRHVSDFAEAEETAACALEMAKAEGLPIFHTGDLIDFVSYANLDEASRLTREADWFMAAGNHEFSLYVGEAREDAAYRERSLARVQAAFTNDIRFSSRIQNDVNFIAMDNSYYLIEPQQLAALESELAKGLPTVLLLHTPLYTEELYNDHKRREPNAPAYLMNVPQEKMADYSPDRLLQQSADETTRKAYNLILASPCVKAILAGHIHYDHEGTVRPGLVQICTGCATIRRVHFC